MRAHKCNQEACDVSDSLEDSYSCFDSHSHITSTPLPTLSPRSLTNTTQGEEIRREQSSIEDMSLQEGQSERDRGEMRKDKMRAQRNRLRNTEAERTTESDRQTSV